MFISFVHAFFRYCFVLDGIRSVCHSIVLSCVLSFFHYLFIYVVRSFVLSDSLFASQLCVGHVDANRHPFIAHDIRHRPTLIPIHTYTYTHTHTARTPPISSSPQTAGSPSPTATLMTTWCASTAASPTLSATPSYPAHLM